MLIAALGSSFAAGPTLEPVADRAAMRSAKNYPNLLAQALHADLIDLTVSGATIANVLDTPQVIAPRVQFAPQLEGLPPDADLVTITTGGNDLRLIGPMLAIAWARHEPAGALAAMLTQQHGDGIPVATPDSVERVAGGLGRIVTETRVRAPRARVVLVDYLTVLDPDSRSALVAYRDQELAAFRGLQAALVDGYVRAAERSGAELLQVSALSRGHGVGSAEPWVADFVAEPRRTAGSFHPNPAGMRAVADALVHGPTP